MTLAIIPKFSIAPGKIEPALIALIKKINSQGQLPALIELYIDRGEIEAGRFTTPVKQAMIDYFIDRGIKINSLPKFNAGEYDEHFAMAYDYAVSIAAGADDPVDSARRKGAMSTWDFTVETFDDVDEQGIVAENILAAGAVDYVHELGHRLGIFDLAEALVLNWSSGSIDVADSPVAGKLYRYWKLLEERSSIAEREMLIRRVLDKGNGEVLNRMVVNEDFPNLWHNLMSEVADYIDKTEKLSEGSSETSPVSRSRIYQATKELQYNLTEFCTGMAHMQVREIYAQLQEAIEILRDPEILAYFGGTRRKSLWTVVEQLSRTEFNRAPNIAAHRTLAVDGNRVYQWIAEFDEATVAQEDFMTFILAAESYILNFPLVTDEDIDDFMDDDEEDDFDDFSEFEDEFDDDF